jgi:hypothetical protein
MSSDRMEKFTVPSLAIWPDGLLRFFDGCRVLDVIV